VRDFFKTTKFKILAALMAVILGIAVYSLTQGGYSPDSASVFSFLFEPFQKLSTQISALRRGLRCGVDAGAYAARHAHLIVAAPGGAAGLGNVALL